MGSTPGSERSPEGGGNGNPLQYSFLPAESHRQRSLVGYSPWGRKKESAMTEVTEQNTSTQTYLYLFINRLTDLSNIICLISSNPKSHEFILSPQFLLNSPRHFKALWRSYCRKATRRKSWVSFPHLLTARCDSEEGQKRGSFHQILLFFFFNSTTLLRSAPALQMSEVQNPGSDMRVPP